eukprot:1846259-Rhodomonas_salina.1
MPAMPVLVHYPCVCDLSQGVAGAKEELGKQMTDFNTAFEKMINQTREALKLYRLADQMYNTAIKQFRLQPLASPCPGKP